MIIDAHCHIFPDNIAEKGVEGIRNFYQGMNIEYDGKLSTMLREGKAAGVDKFILDPVATSPAQVVSINDFTAEMVSGHSKELFAFGAMHPDFEDIGGEMDRIISMGFHGIKLHGDFQNFSLDDERVFPVYEAAEGRLPILFHMGDSRDDRTSPERLMNVVKRFPKLTVIGAHFAGWSEWDKAVEMFADTDIYVDCSSSLYAMSPEHAVRLIRSIGTDRVLWGSDYPMWNYREELERFDKLPLTDEERKLILSENTLRLINGNPTEK